MEVKTIQLSDGRTLGYREYGKPDGIPILICYGFPNLSLLPSYWSDLASKFGSRLIVPERPGYHLSDFQSSRKLLDWPDDVVEIADYLDLNKFGVWGFSGGGPYGVACAYKIPHRLTLTVVQAGLAPFDAFGVPEQVPSDDQWQQNANYIVELTQDTEKYEKYVETLVNNEPDVIHDFLRSDDLRRWVDAVAKESFVNGFQGFIHDARILFAESWGFELDAIDANVQIWHGELDKNVPLSHSEYLAENIPNCQLSLLTGTGHYPTASNFGELLSEFQKAN